MKPFQHRNHKGLKYTSYFTPFIKILDKENTHICMNCVRFLAFNNKNN